jgi:hypothetical protein
MLTVVDEKVFFIGSLCVGRKKNEKKNSYGGKVPIENADRKRAMKHMNVDNE